ncbi:hypothetical protein [Microbispora triticiradicis]|uniref:hypothetical protein n=1 Tax=Microbispora triticiradicis TaxID=2200763 RepID=UPI001AD74B6E|nr:hypothetical protein [Microbispora triticiradicis]MBO4273429.1 hypothetical protein [Microbispora triticiradicis]
MLTDIGLGAWVTRDPTEAEAGSLQLAVAQVAELRRAYAVLELDGRSEPALKGKELYAAHAWLDVILEPVLNGRGELDEDRASDALHKTQEARKAFVLACRTELDHA